MTADPTGSAALIDLQDRLSRACGELLAMAQDEARDVESRARLSAKASGVQLALSYTAEALRDA